MGSPRSLYGGNMETTNIFQARQAKLENQMQNAGLGILALNPGPSLTYLTGLHFHLSERPVVVIFTPKHPPIIVLPELETLKVQGLAYPIQAYPYGENPETWVSAFKKAADAVDTRFPEVGVEPRGLRFLEVGFLEAAFPKGYLVSAESVISALRMHKDKHEINSMQRAVDIAQKALQATFPTIKVGVSELEIASELSMQLLRHGSNPGLAFTPIVSGGPNSANPHASPSNRPLASGDLLVIDYGANVDGYFSDITRTFAIGEVSPEYRYIAEIVLAANKAGREAVKPGVKAGSVDRAARAVIQEASYGDYFTHRTGHGLGLDGHEEPYIREGSDLVLEAGMIFTIEPGIYLPGRNGVRIEDNVLVTPEGVRCLTTLPRELVRLAD
jgi:Xaa-Pro dipeptidase